jgi:thioredoxin reductase (NADPH)
MNVQTQKGRVVYNNIYDVVIIGSGPAGLTAGIYCGRAGLKGVIITGIPWGGQIAYAPQVENFPGFPEGIKGFDLISRIKKQAEKFGIIFIEDEAVEIQNKKSPFRIKLKTGKTINGKTIIIATGRSPRKLGIDGEDRFLGRGISYCATCDGPLYKNKVIGVVGGGDSALSEAIFLADIASKVYIIHRRDQFRGANYLADIIYKRKNIEIKWNKIVVEIFGKHRLEEVVLEDTVDQKREKIKMDGIFIAIGSEPNTAWLKKTIQIDENGYIVVKEDVKTSIDGIFAAGEVVANGYNQAITSAADGCKAGIKAQQWLFSTQN